MLVFQASQQLCVLSGAKHAPVLRRNDSYVVSSSVTPYLPPRAVIYGISTLNFDGCATCTQPIHFTVRYLLLFPIISVVAVWAMLPDFCAYYQQPCPRETWKSHQSPKHPVRTPLVHIQMLKTQLPGCFWSFSVAHTDTIMCSTHNIL